MRLLFFLFSALLAATASAGISSFTANPPVFLPGQEVTLSWSVTVGDSIAISPGVGAFSGATGSVAVLPTAQTTYTLTDSTSNTTAQVTVKPYTPPQLVHRWSFNEASGATVNDSVGTSHGVIRGSGWSRPAGQVSLPGGSSANSPYIDLPNGLISTLDEVTIEGWMTINGSQSWSRVFDFGTGTAGEIIAPGGSATGTEYLLISAQNGTDQTVKRLSMKDNNVEQYVDVGDTVANGQQFHFAVVYDADGNNGQPQVRYYKNGALTGTLNTSFRLRDIVDVNNWLGRSNFTSDANTNGAYNEFRIWDGVMSDSGIANSAAAGPDVLPTSRIESFTIQPKTTIYSGDNARLSYVVSGDGVTASIDQGIGTLSGSSGYVAVSPKQTTTYTLTATGAGGTRTASVTLVVAPSEPTAENLSVTANYQTATAIALIGRDPDTPQNQLTYTIVDAPLHGTLSGTGTARTYTPAGGYVGPDSFTYRINDGRSDSNIATVTITVNPPPIAPTDIIVSEPQLFTNYVTGAFAGRLQTADANPDDRFTYTLVDGVGATHNSFFSISGNQLIAQHNFSGDLNQVISIRVRVTDSTGNSFEKVITMPVQAPDRHVKINEINYNPSRNVISGEFIELYNPFGTAVDIGGWRFTKGIDFTFPPGTAIAPGGYVVVARDPAVIQALYGITALGPWTGGLSSNGDEIVLRDATANIVDKVQYGITSPWPVPPNGDGPSLELVNPELDNDLGGNWRASTATSPTASYITARSSGWRYRKGPSEASSPIGAWRGDAFTEDASWITGSAPIGLFKQNSNTPIATLPETGVTLATQLTDMATYNGSSFTAAYTSVFFRKTFTVSGTIPRAVLLRVMHNDAAIVWINGQEVGRFGFPPSAPNDPPANTAAVYEQSNDPWSEVVLLNAPGLLHGGTNIIAIQGFAKLPQPRGTGGGPTQQDDPANYNIFDFCVDAELKNAPDILGTPGAQNSVFAANCAPAVRDVHHAPNSPRSWEPTVVAAKISDPQGIGSVQLAYQICAPGNYIPSTLPLTNAQILANPAQVPPVNPAFEATSNWVTVPMVDDGSVPGDVAGDGVFVARIPAQPHRTLVRYRITAADLAGVSARFPAANDPRKNYAFFVYDGVPNYVANGQLFASSTLTTLPVYQWVTRSADFSSLLAYNSSEQFSNTMDLNVLLARRFENFVGTLVVGDQVIDHARIRLRGGNSRYVGTGKRHFRFKFPKGTPLDAADEKGNKYARPWEEMLFNKMFGNKGYYDWGLPYEVGGRLWRQQGIPMPESHWVHFRVVKGASEAPDATNGDFWGLYQALELPEGKNFLDARGLPRGNFYKMSDWTQNGEMDQRYQALGAPDFGEDFDNIRYNIHQTTSQSDMERYIHMPLWYRYNAVQEAIRHYDIFVEPTGRHRVKNLIWYFHPKEGTNGLGQLWFMPYDWDASFGPNFNSGWDLVHNALYDHADIIDSPTWSLPKLDRTFMKVEHRNAIRELRDLVWYRDASTGRGPFDDIVDDALATISAFWPADRARWPSTGAQGDNPGGAPWKAQDMKAFAFAGWSDSLASGPAVGAGGRATFLDSISDNLDGGQLPAKPIISYTGVAGFPVDGVTLQSSAFSDPQGASTFAAMQWRIGEITDPTAPAYDANADRIYEVTPIWDTGELTTFNANIAVPSNVLRVGHSYRARVRHKDTSGRWGHWSAPVQFTAGISNYVQVLKDNLMVTELMYHPAAPNAAEAAAGYLEADFEYIELCNISSVLTLDLANVRLTKGVDFDFVGGAITSLPPGARVLIVKNTAAFKMRYGTGKPIAGQWSAGDSLNNSGEQVKVSFGAGSAIQDFNYDDKAPWPEQADAGGYSLVLKAPETRPDHTKAANWRASYVFGGTPGGDDRRYFTDWAATNNVTDPLADADGDGVTNLLEYVLGGDPHTGDRAVLPAQGLQVFTVNGVTESYLTLTIRRFASSEDVAYEVVWSPDLATWTANGALVSSTPNGDGTVTEVWRAPFPASVGRYFGQLRVRRP